MGIGPNVKFWAKNAGLAIEPMFWTVFALREDVFRLFWHIQERREDSGMDCNLGLCAGSDNQKGIESGFESLHNSTDSERDLIRESVYFTSTYGSWLQN